MNGELIKLTSNAVKHILSELDRNHSLGIRFSVKFGGCQGLTYAVDYVDTPDAVDVNLNIDGISVYIEPKAVLFLEGMTVDFKTTAISSGFTFENPNAVKKCGCGLSFCSKDSSGNGGACNGQCNQK